MTRSHFLSVTLWAFSGTAVGLLGGYATAWVRTILVAGEFAPPTGSSLGLALAIAAGVRFGQTFVAAAAWWGLSASIARLDSSRPALVLGFMAIHCGLGIAIGGLAGEFDEAWELLFAGIAAIAPRFLIRRLAPGTFAA